MTNNREGFKQFLNAVVRAAKDNEVLRDKILSEDRTDYRAEFPGSDARNLRAGIEFLTGLEEQLVELWNNGWAVGQADHAAHIRGRQYSEKDRAAHINRIMELKDHDV